MYATQQWSQPPLATVDVPKLLDPSILKAARKIYRAYLEVHPEHSQRPLGVALDRFTYRGQVIFAGKPILLPDECFVPFEQMESEMY